MADGLLGEGEAALALGIYKIALARATPRERQRLRVRVGLATARNRRTGTMLDLLKRLEAASFSNAFVGEGLATWLKTLPFDQDSRFLELSEKHATLLPLANWQWNLSVALWAVRECQHLPGDYVELGVFKGHTTLFCAEYVDFQSWPKRWWLYDTFEGIPDDQVAPGWEKSNKSAYENTFSYEEVAARFAGFPNIDLIKGRVPEILLNRLPERIAFMHVDLNNAPAEIGALTCLLDRVSPGGIVLFDDYCWASARAQFDAENAWFAERGLQILPLPTGQGLFIKR